MLLFGDSLLDEVLAEHGPRPAVDHDRDGLLHQRQHHEAVRVCDLVLRERAVFL